MTPIITPGPSRKGQINLPARTGILMMLLLLLLFAGSPSHATALAKQGILDLRGIDISRQGTIDLDGEWAFYPGKLLEPAQLSPEKKQSLATYQTLPGSWNGWEHQGKKLQGEGIATFHLRILPPGGIDLLALRIADIHSAYILWINGQKVAAQGRVSDRAETETESPAVDLPVFRVNGTPLDLVLQVSNHVNVAGGITSSIQLGTDQNIRNQQMRHWGMAIFYIGGLLVMGCYHLLFYCFHRASRSALYFGIYCLLWMASFLVSAECDWVIRLFLPALSSALLHRIELGCFFLSVPVGYAFFHALYPLDFSRRIMGISSALAFVYMLFPLFAPIRALMAAVPLYYAISLVLIVYCLQRLFSAWRRQREGAGFMLTGFLLLGGIACNDMLFDLQIIHTTYLIQLGMFLFILTQGFVLATYFSKAFVMIQGLSIDLEERNHALQNEMQQRSRLEREIVNVSEAERRVLSREIHDGLCQQLTAARLRCAVLEKGAPGQKEQSHALHLLSGLLDQSVNQAYDLARGLWPQELSPHSGGTFLEDFCRRMAGASKVEIRCKVRHHGGGCDNQNVIQLYRIAQEAVTNAVKHARASLIEVTLDCATETETPVLTVRDNGTGKPGPGSPGGLGLQIMHHRAAMIGACLEIHQTEGQGTMVQCRMCCTTCGPAIKESIDD
jgi:signal transduction histidine kinase